ncbi:MAG: choice-of-anchor B family protein [Saprospiraceae bacterium]|nr:choice-of-anchor B family protein [Saprospiraceae bacterium]
MKKILNWNDRFYVGCLIVFFSNIFYVNAQVPQLKLLGRWNDPTIIGSAQYNNAYNEAYGFTVNNREYGIIGSTYGWHIIDVTEPKKPFERMRIKGGTSNESVIHRDFRYHKCHIYAVCDEGSASTLQILDVSQLPDTAFLVYDKKELFYRSHNIYVDENKSRLYTSAEKNDQGFYALGLYDISNPSKPVLIDHYNKFGNIIANHVHDCFVRNDTAYLNCGNDGFAIMDFSDVKNPKPLYTLKPNEYQFSGYNHSGWLTPDGKTYVMADENHGSPLKVFDLSNWSNIKIVSHLWANSDTSKCIPHNPLLSCKYAYIAYYYNGLQVFNIEDKNKPTLIGYYPTSTEFNDLSYEGAWGVYPFLPSGNLIVADMQKGMFIVEGPEKVCNPVNQCGISSNRNEKINVTQVFPVPFHSSLNIKNLAKIRSIEVYSSIGSLIYNNTLDTQDEIEVNTSDWKEGVYILRLITKGGELLSEKIIRL